MSADSELNWLQSWFEDECDGDWEHGYGIKIDFLPGPIWSFKVDLFDYESDSKKCVRNVRRSETNWYVCNITDDKFVGRGGIENLEDMISTFRVYAIEHLEYWRPLLAVSTADVSWFLSWVHNYYYMSCGKTSGIHIGTLDNPGWYLTIELEGTDLSDACMEPIYIERTDDDWMHCFVRNHKFEGPCGPNNVCEVLKIFREWATANTPS